MLTFLYGLALGLLSYKVFTGFKKGKAMAKTEEMVELLTKQVVGSDEEDTTLALFNKVKNIDKEKAEFELLSDEEKEKKLKEAQKINNELFIIMGRKQVLEEL